MATPTIQLGNGNWAGKSDNLLGFYIQNGRFYKQEFTFNRTTTGTYIDSDRYIQTSATNMPRVDYLNNSNGSLILEPQRTNLVTHSSDFSTYSSPNITTTTNNSTSPDGTISANKATPNTANAQHRYTPSYSVTSSTKYAASVFAKKDGYNKIRITENATTGGYADFDLLNGQVLSTSNVDSAIIEDYGDGWYRCIIVETTGSTSFRFDIIVLDDDNNISFVGDGTSSVLLWGAQLEQGGYATSYIPTSGSSVTRNADTCSITNVADRIGQTEGVLYAEIAKADITASEGGVYLSKDANNEIRLNFATGNRLNVFVNVGGSNQVYMDNTSYNLTDYHKIAIKYKLNDYAVYVDGAEIYTDTSANVPTGLDTINFNSFYGKVRDLKVHNTALTDQELVELTGGTATVYNWIDNSSNRIINENGDTIIFT